VFLDYSQVVVVVQDHTAAVVMERVVPVAVVPEVVVQGQLILVLVAVVILMAVHLGQAVPAS